LLLYDTQGDEALLDLAEVLCGKDGSGGKQDTLSSGQGARKNSTQRHLGFAKANIAENTF
jgi:hypothetical protein